MLNLKCRNYAIKCKNGRGIRPTVMTMHLFAMSRAERSRCLELINEYYRLHLPDFPVLKSLEVLKELFD